MDEDDIIDEDFRDQAISALLDLGLTEEEAELEFDDFYGDSDIYSGF